MRKIFAILFTVLLGVTLVACTNDNSPKDDKITVYTRDTASGTRDAFFTAIDFTDAIKDDQKLVNGVLIVDGNGDMISKIKNDENGIGYISLTSLATSELKGLKFNGVEATEQNVLNGSYALKRPFNYIVTSNDTTDADKLAKAFVAYMGTKDAETIIKSKGGIIEVDANAPTWESIKSQHTVANKDNKDVTVIFGGSTSVESIAKELSKDFSSKAGNFKAEHKHTGSGDAYKNTQGSGKDGDSALHIGFASRGFKADEAGAVGTFGQLAFDAVVIVVNSKNKLNSITPEQAKEVYKGDTAKWADVVEKEVFNGEVKVYTRDTASGTRDAFFTAIDFADAIKDDEILVKGVLITDGNGDMITKLKNDDKGIGYISLTSLATSGLKGLKFNGVEANEANVLNNTYGLKRPFMYIVTSNDVTDADKLAKAFVAYMGTKDAELIIKSKGGIIDVNPAAPTWESIKSEYPVANKDNKDVTVIFGGSTSVESIAKELSKDFSAKAGNFKAEHSHSGSGDAYKNTQGSGKDSDSALHIGFASRAFKDTEAGVEGTFGQLAWDAVVAAVNVKNPLDNITSQVLKQIYQGELKNWLEVIR
ncbi:substrate-binding domain-containing protein [Haploplasma axanthum]|nr:substrate-binding domain-containing protein [Haploplasma axanthum]